MLVLLTRPLLVLFAESSGTMQPAGLWTTKEVLITVVSFVGTLLTVGVPVVMFIIRRMVGNAKGRRNKLEGDNAKLKDSVMDLKDDVHRLTIESGTKEQNLRVAKDDLQKFKKAAVRYVDNMKKVEAQVSALQQEAQALKHSRETLQRTLTEKESELECERRRIERAFQTDGRTWTEKVLANVPDFKPLQPSSRLAPIIAILNLKGGVGKTTVTANLGAALDGLGYRVLLLDLDLQGSLTSLFLSPDQQQALHDSQQLIGDFLACAFDAESPNLLEYTQPILPGGKSSLVPTTDQLAYAEMNLTIRWRLRDGNRDPRFLLRRELHLKRITTRYDIVLLDCPPLINVTCVNALAASDYVLVPIMPSRQATVRVPVLLNRLKDIRENGLNTDLNILGILANRTQRGELTLEEENRMAALRTNCKDIWGQEVPLLDTFVPQNTDVRQAEDNQRPLGEEDKTYATFVELAQELTQRLPTFCFTEKDTQKSAQKVIS